MAVLRTGVIFFFTVFRVRLLRLEWDEGICLEACSSYFMILDTSVLAISTDRYVSVQLQRVQH